MAQILIVDDNDAVRRGLRGMLEAEGHAVDEAADGKEALRRFAGSPADLVFADIYMEEMDGLQFLMRLREAWPEARIVAMSGGGFLDSGSVLSAAASLGAVGTLEKPFERAEVLAMLAEHLEPGAETSSE